MISRARSVFRAFHDDERGDVPGWVLVTLDDMAVAAISLCQAAVTAVRATDATAGAHDDLALVQDTYEFLVGGRYAAAAPIYERVRDLVPEAGSREMIRASSYHARKMFHGIEAVRADVEAWDVSSSSAEFVLVRHCLLDEIDRARALYASLSERGIVGVSELATWPILSELRDAIANDEQAGANSEG
ncbi:hypothetical protein [Microbacterium sp. BLY]|uniref:hypothetical protein n=1 Tax=Microbacterium sp. BLY TaxID=2823280 RepID=UPI001B319887|nr:hypothetical protein [Microbacterium sp. BLY]MBP3979059.1 hypothetical protein [Microbacterium sp. BLY]